MRRRDFIKAITASAAAWPLAVRAQQGGRLPVVAFLNSASPDGYVPMVTAFRQGLKEAGYVESQNVTYGAVQRELKQSTGIDRRHDPLGDFVH